MKTTVLLFLLLLVVGSTQAEAELPRTMSYQGVLKDGDGELVPDGDYEMVFRLYDAETGGNVLWEETQNAVVVAGLFNVLLGRVIPLELPFDAVYWLGIQVGAAGPELVPRVELASAAYSLTSRTVADGAITAEKLAEGAVGTEAIADLGILLEDIAQSGAGTWQTIKWNGEQWVVEDDYGVEGTITVVHGEGGIAGYGHEGVIGLSIAEAGIEESMLGDAAVTSTKIQDGTIAFDDVGQNAAGPGQLMKWSAGRGTWVAGEDSVGVARVNAGPGLIGGGSDTEIELGVDFEGTGLATMVARSDHDHDATYVGEGEADVITSTMIGAAEVKTDDLDALAVTPDKLANAAVTAAKLDTSSVSTEKLQKDAVSTDKLQKDAVTEDKLGPAAVTAAKLDTSSVSNEKLQKDAVNAEKIQDRSVEFIDLAQNGAAEGMVVKWVDAKGGWVAAPDEAGLSNVEAGDGLVAAGTDVVTLSADFAGTGFGTTIARSDHDHDTVYVGEGEANSITSGMIGAMEVQTEDLNDGAVTAGKLGTAAVTVDKLGPSAVTSEKIDAGAVTTEKIEDATVQFADLADNGASPGEIIKWTGTAWAARSDSVAAEAGGWTVEGDNVVTAVVGNVGIGTDTPLEKLDVDGTIRMQGFDLPDTTAHAGYVLTSDDNGAGMWLPSQPATGLNLPYDGSAASSTPVFRIQNHGTGDGVWVKSTQGNGVHAEAHQGYGLYAQGPPAPNPDRGAAHVDGHLRVDGFSNFNYDVEIDADLDVSGTVTKLSGSFKIDHPLDPTNKYLLHSFVESPDMMNVYNGNAVLDERGETWVTLPNWFEALNRDFRYQLTAIGAPGPDLYIAEGVAGNRFGIAGGEPGMTVSWQVTGIRHDAHAEAHRIPVELAKTGEEKGKLLDPEAFGQSGTPAVNAVASDAGAMHVASAGGGE